MNSVFVWVRLLLLVIIHAVNIGDSLVVLTVQSRLRSPISRTQCISLQNGGSVKMNLRFDTSSEHDLFLGCSEGSLRIKYRYLVQILV